MTTRSSDELVDALKRKCTFCHAPPGVPCRTVLYEEHVEHGNGKEHSQPHAARFAVQP